MVHKISALCLLYKAQYSQNIDSYIIIIMCNPMLSYEILYLHAADYLITVCVMLCTLYVYCVPNVCNLHVYATVYETTGDRKLLEVLGGGSVSVQRTQSAPSQTNKGSDSESDEEVIISASGGPTKKTSTRTKGTSVLL